MNYPYSSKKWLTISMAALMIASANAAYADTATSPQTPAGNTTPAADPQAASKESPSAAETLTLEKAIAQALETNSALQSLRLDVKNADTNARLVQDAVRGIPSDAIESADAAQNKYARDAEAKMSRTINAISLKSAESKTKVGAQKAYYDMLHAQADVQLKKQSLSRAQAQLKVVNAAFTVGTRAKTDVLQAEMGVAGAQAALTSAENNLLITGMKLNQFLGLDVNKQWTLKDENKPVKAADITLDKAIEQALKQRFEVTQKQEQLKLAQLKYDLIAEYSAASTWPGQIAKANIEKAQLAAEDQNRDITLEVSEAYYNMTATKLAVEFKKKALDSAAENYRLTNLRFENGLATTLDVIDAEEKLADQENQYQEAIRSYNLVVVNYGTALGQ